MENYNLTTIFTSNSPLDCHILKGRLESEGLYCFIFDEFIVSVHPFRAVAVGGVKLKVPTDQLEYGNKIISNIKNDKLVDSDGEYDCKTVFENEFNRQNEILNLKNKIRNNPQLLSNRDTLKSYINNECIDDAELNKIISEETEFNNLTKQKVKIDFRDLLNDFFEYGFNIFEKLKIKPVNYFLEKELVDNYCGTDSGNKY